MLKMPIIFRMPKSPPACAGHTPSNTAFRGFGGPQGMIGIERIMDQIAAHLGRDPVAVRAANYYPDYQAASPWPRLMASRLRTASSAH